MVPDGVARPDADGDVMASVETGRTDRFIIADVTRDEAFVTVPLEAALSLPEWR